MAVGLMLILEGIIPFLFPKQWRQAFEQLTRFNDGQLRFFGLAALLVGSAVLFVVL
jgi:uncharacterized protein YjeT (DUF2065 family)